MLSSVKMETHDLPEWNTFYSEASEVKSIRYQVDYHFKQIYIRGYCIYFFIHLLYFKCCYFEEQPEFY